MEVLENYDIKELNTFGVKAKTRYFTELHKEEEIPILLALPEFKKGPVLFLGGGSNVLITRDWEGLVVLNKQSGIEIIKEDSEFAWVRAAGGEVWHNLVLFAVARELWGIENLSFIPGTVGAAPMQNIGAYGAELKETLDIVEAYDLATGEKKIFQNHECAFGYRDSIFKNQVRGKYFISAVVLRLSKKENKNITYRALKEYFKKKETTPKTIKDISDAVVEIRKSKLPDPKILGNAGSFFKNVFVDEEELRELQQNYPNIPNFRDSNQIKIPAGWLIEECGWKGKRVGNVGMHEKQALVLVNYGGATGEELKTLAQLVIDSVHQKFGLKLTPEVNFV